MIYQGACAPEKNTVSKRKEKNPTRTDPIQSPVVVELGIRTDIPKSHRRGRPIHRPASVAFRSSFSFSDLESKPVSLNPLLLATLAQLPILLTLLLREADPRLGMRVSMRMFSRLMSLWQTPAAIAIAVVLKQQRDQKSVFSDCKSLCA